ncbi:hypothetical protein [Roseateles sp. PN1]|uniref:hypothetical protein n=1 Tax=Roseateles sp. PN1 TaxID=3137372 RepID=UPI0031392460
MNTTTNELAKEFEFDVSIYTKENFEKLTLEEQKFAAQIAEKLAAVKLINSFLAYCRNENIDDRLSACANLNFDEFIDHHGGLDGESKSAVKKHLAYFIFHNIKNGTLDEVYSAIVATNGKISFLNEAGELV